VEHGYPHSLWACAGPCLHLPPLGAGLPGLHSEAAAADRSAPSQRHDLRAAARWRAEADADADSLPDDVATLKAAHGFTVEMLAGLVRGGLATATPKTMHAGGQPIEVTWLTIADAGRLALTGD
jgi:hypothetical protein